MTDPTPPAEKDALKSISDERLAEALASIEHDCGLDRMMILTVLRELQSRRTTPNGEAVAAARRIVSGWQRSLSMSGYFEEGDPLTVARALLASSGRDDSSEGGT